MMYGYEKTSEYMALLRKYMVENAHKYGIMRMGIFGSVARGEQTEDSDVDVCVELQTPSYVLSGPYKGRASAFVWLCR
mgnify:CR=1 FL=1